MLDILSYILSYQLLVGEEIDKTNEKRDKCLSCKLRLVFIFGICLPSALNLSRLSFLFLNFHLNFPLAFAYGFSWILEIAANKAAANCLLQERERQRKPELSLNGCI